MSEKLVIRINNLQDKEESQFEHRMITTIHWDRIISFSLAVFAVIGVLIWLFFSVVSDEPVEPLLHSQIEPDVSEITGNVGGHAVDNGADSVEAGLSRAEKDTPAESADQLGVSVAESEVASQISVEKAGPFESVSGSMSQEIEGSSAFSGNGQVVIKNTDAGFDSDKPEKMVETKGRETKEAETGVESVTMAEIPGAGASTAIGEIVDEPDRDMQPVSNTEKQPPSSSLQAATGDDTVTESLDIVSTTVVDLENPESPEGMTPFESDKPTDTVSIASRHIIRAQLTSWVKRKEPVDQLGPVVNMNDQSLIRVFLFTDMEGLAGETLYHNWYLGDKRMARVKIPVKNQKARASSSKFIDRHMLGHWTVKVTDTSGNLLVKADFDVSG